MEWNLQAVTLLVPLVFLLLGLTVTVAVDPYISPRHRFVMLLIVALSAILIAQNQMEDALAEGSLRWLARTAVSVLGYTLRPVFLVLFLYIIRPEKKHWLCWGLILLNALVHMTAFFSHICFWIDKDNHYQGGPLSNFCLIVSLILLAYLFFVSLRDFRRSRMQDMLLPILVVPVILISVYLDFQAGSLEQPVTFLTCSIVVSSIFYYIWLHLRFVRDHEDDLKARQRMQIMISQIQPHFLYNTLSAIQYLCDSDPKMAGKMTERFSRYLQGNMSVLRDEGEVPFTRELEHTRVYLEIEQIRFGDALRVVYDIACTDFSLPTLTLQPIVENAVRHGVRGQRKSVGTVTIATREYPDRYEVTVEDDGPGFDPEAPVLSNDGREHIGIPNVRERLEQMKGGALRIRSVAGKGTLVTLEIPKAQRT